MAKKNNLKARLKYYEEYSSHCKDGYALELNSDGEWGLSHFWRCVRHSKQTENDEAEFIHFTVLTEVEKCLALGYEVEFLGRVIKY